MLPVSIVVRCAYDYDRLKKCLASIDEHVDIVVSTAVDSAIVNRKFQENITVVTHSYGNWSLATEVGLQKAKNSKVIIMDADSTFEKKAVASLYRALSGNVIVVKPKVVFLYNQNYTSKLNSDIRTHQNEYKPKAFTPGLAIDQKKLLDQIGVNKHLYDVRVKYADDGNLNKRIYEAGIPIKLLNTATIYHEPVTLKHEIKTAYVLGMGNRQAEDKFDLAKLLHEETSRNARSFYIKAYKRFGFKTVMGLLVWRIIYYFGYFSKGN